MQPQDLYADINRFQLENGWEILVGRTAKANDRLSIRVGSAGDFWFHVAGRPGAHVVARHPDRPLKCPKDIKQLAGGLAAFYSKAKTGGKVSIHMTTVKFVGKPRGAPPGTVSLKKFDSLTARPVDPTTSPLLVQAAEAATQA